jgi:hypothetical protein
VQGWYAAFLEHVALPNVGFFNFIIPVGEFLAGLALILGVATIPALLAGMPVKRRIISRVYIIGFVLVVPALPIKGRMEWLPRFHRSGLGDPRLTGC